MGRDDLFYSPRNQLSRRQVALLVSDSYPPQGRQAQGSIGSDVGLLLSVNLTQEQDEPEA